MKDYISRYFILFYLFFYFKNLILLGFLVFDSLDGIYECVCDYFVECKLLIMNYIEKYCDVILVY